MAEAGATVHTRASARRLIPSDGGGFEVEGDGLRLAADAVIAAVPHDRVLTLLPDGALRQPVGQLGVSPIVNVHVVYDRKVTDLPVAAGLHSPVQWVFDRTAPSGLDRGQYLAVSVSGADREMGERTEALRLQFLPAIAAMFPAAREARVERFFVTREPRATFRQVPGTGAFRPGPSTAVPGLFEDARFATVEVHGVYTGPLNWVEHLAPRRLPSFLRRWERTDGRLADRPALRGMSNMLLVKAELPA